MSSYSFKNDFIGALAAFLCLIHCIATPLLFLYASKLHLSNTATDWWPMMDILFISLSFYAILKIKTQQTPKWVQASLWISWLGMCFIILNEKLEIIPLKEEVIYIPSIFLILLHLYNIRFCKCANDACCVSK